MKQQEDESLAEYSKRFNNAVDILRAQSGPIIMREHMVCLTEFRAATPKQQDTMMVKEHVKLMAFAFLLGTDHNRSRKLVEDLSNQFTIGEDKYPKDVAHAVNMVSNHRNKINNNNNNRRNNNYNNNYNKNNKKTDQEFTYN